MAKLYRRMTARDAVAATVCEFPLLLLELAERMENGIVCTQTARADTHSRASSASSATPRFSMGLSIWNARCR